MTDLLEQTFYCPYCGESMSTLVEPTFEDSEYIEDCQVCCRPIVFAVSASLNGELAVSVRTENDTI